MSGDLRYRSLFVSDLAPEVTEATLLNAFSPLGPIVSVRIVRHRETRQSLGYGYVNFIRESDARTALNTKNFMEINGKPIRITAAQTDPSRRKANNANIFVKNLDKSVDNKQLYEIFKQFGPIMSCKLAQEVNGESKGFGFVQFEFEQNAVDAIVAMNGRLLNGKILFCCKFLPKNERQKSMKNSLQMKSYANIYVKNLSPEFDDNLLMKMFVTFGPVIGVKVYHKSSKSFGFVCFGDSITAENAVKALNGKPLSNGGSLYVSRAFRMMQKSGRPNRLANTSTGDGRSVYVKYLDHSIDNQKLAQLFSNFGEITGSMTYFPIGFYQPTNGFGFVRFTSPESAEKAVQQMNNKSLPNKPLFVSIAKSSKKRNTSYLATDSSIKATAVNSLWNQSLG